MISSSNSRLERGLDAMLLVYSLLESHPASAICEQFIRTHTGWFTTTLTLLEVKAILTKVYGVDGHLATQKLMQVTMGPLAVLSVEGATVVAAMGTADALGIDLTDAVLLQTVQEQGVARLATDDSKLTQVCRQSGIIPENPIDTALRQQMAAWEATNLPTKGLPRLLYQIYHWLSQNHLTHPQPAGPAAWRPTLARLQLAGRGRQGGRSRRWKSPCDFPIRQQLFVTGVTAQSKKAVREDAAVQIVVKFALYL